MVGASVDVKGKESELGVKRQKLEPVPKGKVANAGYIAKALGGHLKSNVNDPEAGQVTASVEGKQKEEGEL